MADLVCRIRSAIFMKYDIRRDNRSLDGYALVVTVNPRTVAIVTSGVGKRKYRPLPESKWVAEYRSTLFYSGRGSPAALKADALFG